MYTDGGGRYQQGRTLGLSTLALVGTDWYADPCWIMGRAREQWVRASTPTMRMPFHQTSGK